MMIMIAQEQRLTKEKEDEMVDDVDDLIEEEAEEVGALVFPKAAF